MAELRRHFRDKGWGTHVTRTVQENLLNVTAASDALATSLGRTPNTRDIADATGISREDVNEALEAGRSYKPASLDAPIGGESEPPSLRDTLGSIDQHYDYVEIGATIEPAFGALELGLAYLRSSADVEPPCLALQLSTSRLVAFRSGAIAQLVGAGLPRAVSAAVDGIAVLDAVADDPAPAVRAGRSQGMDRALERVKSTRRAAGNGYLHRLVVVVATDLTGRHVNSPGRWTSACPRPPSMSSGM